MSILACRWRVCSFHRPPVSAEALIEGSHCATSAMTVRGLSTFSLKCLRNSSGAAILIVVRLIWGRVAG